eukprot:Awhi_evm1s14361
MSSNLTRLSTQVNQDPNAGQVIAQEQATRLGHLSALDIYSEPDRIRRSSIICTIGPKSGTPEMLLKLRHAGMNVMRLNFSHGSYEFHGGLIKNLRDTFVSNPGPEVAIALDTKGPEVRTGLTATGEDIKLTKGMIIKLTSDQAYMEKGTAEVTYCDYVNLPKVVSKGSTIYVDDGLLSLTVQETGDDFVVCKVENDGLLGGKKGCNLPNIDVDLPALSEKDKSDLRWGVEQGVDMVFASFIRKGQDIKDVRACLGEKGKNIKIMAKIESHEGCRNFDEILEQVDGIMVARGDLGIEVPPEKVFLAQKMMIAKCNMAGKPVICATQMLDSMTYNPRPTRAEVGDVANAILDGADCVMLSGETAKGLYAVETVEMMGKTCIEAESAFYYRTAFDDLRATKSHFGSTSETIALAAVEASFEQKLAGIIVLTTTGSTARMVSKYRPRCPIFMVTRNAQTARQGHLSRGVLPMYYKEDHVESFQDDVDARIHWALSEAKKNNYLKAGDEVMCIQGWRGGS